LYKHSIKYPVAFNQVTKKNVPIDEVTKDNRLKLICPVCKDNFIAIINHRTPHFRHKPNTECSGSLESYIHWLTKEVFKQIGELEMPELLIDDLPEKHRQKFQLDFNAILDTNIPYSFQGEFKKGLKANLTDSKNLAIEGIETEKEYNTELGKVRIDIIATVGDKEYFIEPFFSNSIDDDKKKKLSQIKKPTLSIDLVDFLDNFYFNFSFETLKKYLISKKSKKWEYLSEDEYGSYVEDYLQYLLQEIRRNKPLIDNHNSKLEKIATLEEECDKRKENINILRKEIREIEDEILSLKDELNVPYY